MEKELRENPRTRQILAEGEQLHQLEEQAITAALSSGGQSPRQIYQRAAGLAQINQSPKTERKCLRLNPGPQIAISLAAGLLLGLILYPVLQRIQSVAQYSTPSNRFFQPNDGKLDVARNINGTSGLGQGEEPTIYQSVPDLYMFTDPTGTEWLIERYPQNNVILAAFNRDI
jgi:hypothetical protein